MIRRKSGTLVLTGPVLSFQPLRRPLSGRILMMNMMQDHTADSDGLIDRRIVKIDYRNYDLVARYWEYSYFGKVWKNRKAIEEFDAMDGEGIDALIIRMKQFVDEQIEILHNNRKGKKPAQSELDEALRALLRAGKVPELCKQALITHAQQADGVIDSSTLQRLTGLSSTAAICTLYSNLAVKICDEIGYCGTQYDTAFPALKLIVSQVDESNDRLMLSNCAKKMICEMDW